ncbi:sugar phosphate isomerase/epimerase family protein [Paenibacillus sp. MBLB4367]|uniref:sugar phosphate isomerase/epimerase family protein n=1 Tax=Paenibacillus sp. MBLB4367 TaxID=3384767 RepID=UPI00390837B5
MIVKLFKSLWGMEELSYRESFALIAEAGYAGVESGVPAPEHVGEFKELLDEYKLEYIALISTSGNHGETFALGLERAAAIKPLLVISHSARDCMPYEEQLQFFRQALEAERSAGVPVGHETHRRRAMFTPWSTAQLLRDLPELKITADFSHWCCVCESLLEDQTDALQLAFERTLHVHARVGYAEGPQVPHPAAPEYARELEAHMAWWRQIVRLRERSGFAYTTVTPEFGPPGYMHTLPFTNQPVADLWDTCLWMAKHVRMNFE